MLLQNQSVVTHQAFFNQMMYSYLSSAKSVANSPLGNSSWEMFNVQTNGLGVMRELSESNSEAYLQSRYVQNSLTQA